jgi:hypothetical protein
MPTIPRPPRQRQARPKRGQFDPAHHDRANLREARKIISDRHNQPQALVTWAETFLQRIEREGGLACIK